MEIIYFSNEKYLRLPVFNFVSFILISQFFSLPKHISDHVFFQKPLQVLIKEYKFVHFSELQDSSLQLLRKKRKIVETNQMFSDKIHNFSR